VGSSQTHQKQNGKFSTSPATNEGRTVLQPPYQHSDTQPLQINKQHTPQELSLLGLDLNFYIKHICLGAPLVTCVIHTIFVSVINLDIIQYADIVSMHTCHMSDQGVYVISHLRQYTYRIVLRNSHRFSYLL
jgi:hypothetical protein